MSGGGEGQGDGRCGAKTRGGGKCKRPSGSGTDHIGVGRCKLHGGSTPNHVKSAEKVMASMAVEQYGLPREVDPQQALLEEMARTAGHVEWLRLQVGELETDNMTGPVGGGQGGFPEFKPNVWIGMYNAERKHLTEVAATCIKVGIAERQIKLAEQQGLLIAEAIKGILSALGVDLDAPKTKEVVRKHLTGLSAPPALQLVQGAS